MKNLLFNLLRIKDRKILQRQIKWSPDLKVWRSLIPSTISWVRMAVGSVNRSKAIQAATFAKFMVNLAKSGGVRSVVLYLKTAHVLLMQCVPGSEMRAEPRAVGKTAVSRTRDGIPRCIPRFARVEIRRGNQQAIRLYLTFFGIYRVLKFIGKPSVHTILSPGVVLSQALLTEWTGFIWRTFLPNIKEFTGWKMRGLLTSKTLSRPEPRVILGSSADSTKKVVRVEPDDPTGKAIYDSSFASRFNSAKNWADGTWGWLLYQYLREVPGGANTTKSLYTMILETAEMRSRYAGMDNAPKDFSPRGDVCNGRLAFLDEPAGKVRVIALLDYWSQLALHPLHAWIFECLKEIPTDGTFNQLAPVKRLLKKVSKDTIIYSYDLSAATDRLPVKLQSLLLACIFGKRFATVWKRLLVNRSYKIGKSYVDERLGIPPVVKYSVGQPMGGYSSWAMLALTHHAMVQFAAYRAGIRTWFDLYAVLGDDVVIAHCAVAREYLRLCKEIGVSIGIHKSLIAKGFTLEFAKKFFFHKEDCSGMPVAFWAAAQTTMGVAHALSVWTPAGTLSNFLRGLGVGFKGASGVMGPWNTIPSRLRALVVTLTHPLVGSRYAFTNWPEWIWSTGPGQKGLNLNTLVQFTPYATALLEEILFPARKVLEDYQEDIFFTEKVNDPASRLVDSKTNRLVTEAENSLTKGEEAMKHLQRLNIKFNLTQVSAVLTQVTRAAEKSSLVPVPATRAMVKVNTEPRLVKVSDIFRYWNKIRERGVANARVLLSGGSK